MKKFLRANYKPIVKGLILAAVLIFAYVVLHNIATAERGYNAIGGEATVFLLPILWWARPSLKDLKEGKKNVHRQPYSRF